MNASTRDKAYRVAKEIKGDGAHSGGVLDLLAGGLVAERDAVDPLFAELAALEAIRPKGDGDHADDKRCPSELPALALEHISRADSMVGADCDYGDAVYRDAMLHAAMYCLAAVRCIDRAHKP